MPYQFDYEKMKIPRELDRRVKITPELRKEVIAMYKCEGLGIREIARRVPQISRRSVQMILFPDRYKLMLEQFKERRLDGRYKPDKEKWASTMREHRAYKQSIKEKLI